MIWRKFQSDDSINIKTKIMQFLESVTNTPIYLHNYLITLGKRGEGKITHLWSVWWHTWWFPLVTRHWSYNNKKYSKWNLVSINHYFQSCHITFDWLKTMMWQIFLIWTIYNMLQCNRFAKKQFGQYITFAITVL